MAAVKTENLTFSYPQGSKKALKNVNLDVHDGEFLLIFGPSGCGKSTLLKHFFPGMEPYGERSGMVYLDGKNLYDADRREICERIGFVGQNVDAQVITDRVWHELAFTLENLGYDSIKMKSRIAEIASYFSISDWLERKTESLSGGEKQKLNLAVSMLSFPDLLILDEPVSQLDPVMKEEFLHLVKRINEDYGTTVIMCEHDLSGALSLADRCILMEEGRIVHSASASEMCSLLCRSDYFDFLPETVKAGYLLLERTDILSAKDLKELLKDKNIRYSGSDDYPVLSENAVEVKNAWFRYERNGKDILRDVSFNLSKGDFLCLVGPNGSGKTTFLGVLAGALRPYRGKVRKHLKTAMLPQRPVSLFIRNTVREDFENISGDYEALVKRFSLEQVLDRHPYDLSGGEIELCALIKVLLSDPDVIILDEPTKGIDASYKKQLGQVLEELNRAGKTIILATHDIEFCARYTGNCAVMFDSDMIGLDRTARVLSDNYFYTTELNRALKQRDKRILLLDEVSIDD